MERVLNIRSDLRSNPQWKRYIRVGHHQRVSSQGRYSEGEVKPLILPTLYQSRGDACDERPNLYKYRTAKKAETEREERKEQSTKQEDDKREKVDQ